MKRNRVTPEEFVRAWQAAGSVAEVAAALGMTKHATHARALRYRKMGVILKRFPPGVPKGRAVIDVAALNEIAKEGGNE